MTFPAAVLAIDGGNSKTDVALVAADGTLLARTVGPASPAPTVGMDECLRILGELTAKVAHDAGLSLDDGPIAQHIAAYLAGVDVPQEEAQMHEVLSAQHWSATTTVDNDTFAIFRAGTMNHWGVGVVAGAGINACGIAKDGTRARYLAIGETTGDFGGGGDLSHAMIWWSFRAEDGRERPTALLPAILDHYGLPSMHDVAIALHLGDITTDERLALTRVLFRVAAETADPIAVSLVDRQAREVAVMARQLLRKLDLIDVETDVVLGGGVLTSRDPMLTRLITQWMAREAPHGHITFNDVPAVTGAALLGFDHLGIGRQAEDRLRADMRF